MKIKVGNLHDGRKPTNGVYIGRGSIWGNPFQMTREDDRGEVIKKYAKWLRSQPNIVTKIEELRGKELRCFCAPKPCHGHVLLMLAQGIYLDDVIKNVCKKL
ncbi:DUF4326 domain-containing protein [Candidatus Phycosocius bacilliformis]|uniref:DUF4326 domain-containing protein n=1 Tax=Candidatus Phycosocius bacilliformis TaxID=1445552 RepID=UPI000D59C085|nr:DUF4326 domain-containing protein [Candidatus Phycosocius bacilliformis]